ncbi:hypothetical protein AMJ44_10020 [candidate division WOR-1 bacterium DG_54_3]|uniref:Glycosyltransferase 2-like domain-containing protein n=1 Tax=candidate division WOR-1 bacterium DG_54_3 TaxID=1703775 RepID=A0A0S7XSQ1_UNCSA|nr:MAG: hypothetical protein AMJ44_10020 [candidate division WOR-1 bacterium DG_54_3]
MEIIFLTLILLSLYSYSIYPLVLFVISRGVLNLWDKKDIRQTVSIIISVYNEESIIEEKIQNTLKLDYPKDLVEIVVVSDGSTDRTVEIVSGIHDPRLVLRAFSERSGKTSCLNRVVPEAKGDIVLFSDANSMFSPNLLRKLVRNFACPEVGLVTGWTKYRNHRGGERTSGTYSELERWTKYWESIISSCVGADGAIFAIRKSLFRPLEDHDINDFVIPLHVLKQGKRAVLDPEVFCFEEPSKGVEQEYHRQVRITTRTLGAILCNKEFINPWRYRSFSFFLISHKLIRFLVPFFLLGIFLTNLFLLNGSIIYAVILCGQIFVLVLGLLSILDIYTGKLSSLVKFYLITVSAQLVGWSRMLLGIKDTIWTPQR